MARAWVVAALAAVAAACSGQSGTAGGDGGDGARDLAAFDGNAIMCGTCFVHGRWKIDNLSPCFNTSFNPGDAGPVMNAVSTYLDGNQVMCPADPTVLPTHPWSTDTLTVDCRGHYRLCVTLKAGDARSPRADDCTVAQSCAEGDYTAGGQPQSWAALPAWISTPAQLDCASAMYTSGGYSELSVSGAATGCGAVGKVFTRIPYCPLSCNANPSGPGCAACAMGVGDGSF